MLTLESWMMTNSANLVTYLYWTMETQFAEKQASIGGEIVDVESFLLNNYFDLSDNDSFALEATRGLATSIDELQQERRRTPGCL